MAMWLSLSLDTEMYIPMRLKYYTAWWWYYASSCKTMSWQWHFLYQIFYKAVNWRWSLFHYSLQGSYNDRPVREFRKAQRYVNHTDLVCSTRVTPHDAAASQINTCRLDCLFNGLFIRKLRNAGRKHFPHHHGLPVPTCTPARASCRDR